MSSKRELRIDISISEQRLTLYEGTINLFARQISTAKNGPGELFGSECTPRGAHIIRAKIGDSCPLNTVFIGRRPTGERYTLALDRQYPDRDWILTRILWLSGLQRGVNRLGHVDTMRRYIYIHGTPDTVEMGVPDSHGCIRMTNNDVIQLFDLVYTGVKVFINE